MTPRKTPATPQDGTTRATAMGGANRYAKPLRPTPDVPCLTPRVAGVEKWCADHAARHMTFADLDTWHTLKHAPATSPDWDATWLVVALMLLAAVLLGYIVGALQAGGLPWGWLS